MNQLIRQCIIILASLFFTNVINGQQDYLFSKKENYRSPYRQEQFVRRAVHYDLNKEVLQQKLNQPNVKMTVPTLANDKNIILEKVQVLSPHYQLTTSDGKKINNSNEYRFFHGKVQGDPTSKVVLSVINDEIKILIADRDGNFEINKLENEVYAGYYNRDQLRSQVWECYTEDLPAIQDEKGSRIQQNTRNTNECVDIYLEIDYAMYTKKGSSVPNTEAWAVALMNEVSILYIEWGITLSISGIHVYTSTDPFANTGNTSATLPIFRDSMNNKTWNGRLAHLLSGRSMGGGIAYLSTLCSNYSNVAISGNLNGGVTPYPSYSWNVMVVAHELGHNFGSPHTHACAWNDNNTAIDGCYTPEGSCDRPPQPGPEVGGTIMSYCHLTSSGIKLSNGFGLQPGALIQSRFLNASCVTGESCDPVPPFNDICSRAINLNIINACVINPGTNLAATPSGNGGNLSCGNGGTEKDVWYKIEVPNINSFTIETKDITNGLQDMIIELYTGDCNNLTSYACDDNSGENNQAKIMVNDPGLQGQTIYLRVMESGSDEEGRFGICTFSAELPCDDIVDSLVNFYLATNGQLWTNNYGWSAGATGEDCQYCDWYGITCDVNGNIVGIDLNNNNLSGSLVSSLSTLSSMKNLDLSGNILSGPLPDIWDHFPNLELLYLNDNQFSGEIPENINSLSKLTSLSLDNNQLTGPIPPDLGRISSLRYLTASNNQLSGCFPRYMNYFCWRDSVNFDNNPGLPFGGDISILCGDYTYPGLDYDLDMHCSGIDDCDDYNESIYDGAQELCDGYDNNCDGTIDDGLNSGPNIWQGSTSGGNWNNGNAWSMGHTPMGCEDLEIGMNGTSITLDVPTETVSVIKSLKIGSGSILSLQQQSQIEIRGGGNLINHGELQLSGRLYFMNQTGKSQDAFINNGLVIIQEGGFLYIQDVGNNGLMNQIEGIITNNGSITIASQDSIHTQSGILNKGAIHNYSGINVYGKYGGPYLQIKSGAILKTYGTRSSISLDNFNGEGQGRESDN